MSLEKIAFITAILGIIVLFFLSENLEPQLITINKLTIKDIDNYVKIQGNITYIKQYESSTLLKIDDGTEKIYAVFYGKMNLTKDIPVVITGKVTEYKGILEIEISKIVSDEY